MSLRSVFVESTSCRIGPEQDVEDGADRSGILVASDGGGLPRPMSALTGDRSPVSLLLAIGWTTG